MGRERTQLFPPFFPFRCSFRTLLIIRCSFFLWDKWVTISSLPGYPLSVIFSKTYPRDTFVSKRPRKCAHEYTSLIPVNYTLCIIFVRYRFHQISLQVICLGYWNKTKIPYAGCDFKETRETDDQKSHVSGPAKGLPQPLSLMKTTFYNRAPMQMQIYVDCLFRPLLYTSISKFTLLSFLPWKR